MNSFFVSGINEPLMDDGNYSQGFECNLGKNQHE